MGDILKIGPEYTTVNGTRINCITAIDIKCRAGDLDKVTITFDTESIEYESCPEVFGPTLFHFQKEPRLWKIKKKVRDFLILKLRLGLLGWKIRKYFRNRQLRRAEGQSRQDSDTS